MEHAIDRSQLAVPPIDTWDRFHCYSPRVIELNIEMSGNGHLLMPTPRPPLRNRQGQTSPRGGERPTYLRRIRVPFSLLDLKRSSCWAANNSLDCGGPRPCGTHDLRQEDHGRTVHHLLQYRHLRELISIECPSTTYSVSKWAL